jgi:monothiol glutaredoxin
LKALNFIATNKYNKYRLGVKMSNSSVDEKINKLIVDNKNLLFMKGTKTNPMCGFSAQVVNLLNNQAVDYETVNVLDDWDIREGIKSYSNWPTIPQLYVAGEFIGGCDIVMELDRSGELTKVFSK